MNSFTGSDPEVSEDEERFTNAIMAVSEYYGRTIKKSVIYLYWLGLRNYHIEDVERAVAQHLRNPDTGQFMPKIADFVRMIEGGTKDTAAQAWSIFEEGLRRVGTYRDIVFPDPIIHKVVQDMGGWIEFGNKKEKDWPFVAQDFQSRYRAFKARSVIPEYPPVLRGVVNGSNRSNGYALEPPAYFGPEALCKQVQQLGSVQHGTPHTLANDAQRLITRIADQRNARHAS